MLLSEAVDIYSLYSNINFVRKELVDSLDNESLVPLSQKQFTELFTKVKTATEDNLKFLGSCFDNKRTQAEKLAEILNEDSKRQTLTSSNFTAFFEHHGPEVEQHVDHNDASSIIGAMFQTLDNVMRLSYDEKAYLGDNDVQINRNITELEDISLDIHNALASIFKNVNQATKKQLERVIYLSRRKFTQKQEQLLKTLSP